MEKVTYQINQIGENEWQIPQDSRFGMTESVIIFANQKMINQASKDESLDQAVNAASLPGLAGPVVVMPDVHQGYGFPIGGVAAFRYPSGVVSPGAIGYDINCGVRLLSSDITLEDAEPYLDALATRLDQLCPSGLGSEGTIHLTKKDLDTICRTGSNWAIKNGWGGTSDLDHTEENGCLYGADPEWASQHAHERGRDQMGTLGSGNHFIEVDVIDEVFDLATAAKMHL
jgi:tRNA-splicing ligase RtcB (3'-phosphate/5'-hydroxy nucleic acid ligase)